MWYSRRPEPGEGIIVFLIMLLINIALLPIMGIVGIMSENEDDKAQGMVMLIIGIIIWGYVILNMGK